MSLNLIAALILSASVSYLLGSCNSSIIVVRLWKKKDVREYGSKNAGLTNTLRCFGKGPAALTLLGDLSKGILAVLLSRLIVHLLDAGIGPDNNIRFIGYIAGFFAILGHIFPAYYGFKGGKGVLVAASILIITDPITFCIVIPFFALILAITKYVSVASISAAIAYPLITFLTQYYISGIQHDLVILHTLLVVGTSLLLIYMHKSNIQRLKNHTENKFSFGKKSKEGHNG